MLKFDTLSVFYGKKQVLFDISASIERGKFTDIIGRNGSGKSTLLSALTSQTAYSGKILLDGRDISSIDRRERAKMISFLPQNLPVTQFTVGETVAFGREPHISFKLTDADLMLLDEPTTYMDAPNARDFLKILSEERDRGKSVVAVMHDLTSAAKYADDILLIDGGKVLFKGTKEKCLEEKAIENVMEVESHKLDDGRVVFI